MATFVIAEAGVNHNGELALAMKLVEAAASAGADAVKFRHSPPPDLTTANTPKAEYQTINDGTGNQRRMLERLELTTAEHYALAAYCEECSIQFLSTAFGQKELDQLLDIGISAIKVASGEITNRPLLGAANATKKRSLPVYLSTGMSTLGDVEEALRVFIDAGISRQVTAVYLQVPLYREIRSVAMKSIECTGPAGLLRSHSRDHSTSSNSSTGCEGNRKTHYTGH